ncbi:EamA family transporter [Nonomuraea sp. NPDC000554]|uniref:DMT family transporter n=1 Tax=Nonomuraea sp. NPDC000554 TaxID=3154259 RepID=UPI0033188EBC
MTHVSARRGALYASVAAAAWGTGGAAGALLFQSGGLGPVDVSLWRYLLGAVFLLAVSRLAARRRPAAGRPANREPAADPVNRPGAAISRRASAALPRLLLLGVGMAVYQTAYFVAIARSGVAIATVVTMGATPVFTALGSRFLLGERLERLGLAALVTALAGLLLLTGESALGGVRQGQLAGVGFALLSAAGYAGVTLHSRRHRDDPEGTAIGGFVVGACCLAPFALADGVLPAVNLPSLALLVYLGAVPTALAYGLFFRALTALSATTVSIISLGEAVGAAVLGVALMGERLTPLGWSGCALLLAAVTVLASAGREHP